MTQRGQKGRCISTRLSGGERYMEEMSPFMPSSERITTDQLNAIRREKIVDDESHDTTIVPI